ncbi:hypothetical protein BKA63DRAFT_589914 [Paraphoma chrysanthemicola]|nr:hypothetical protein BKA63DRAFT_589914 [Paraphoma chrysanthemicola]
MAQIGSPEREAESRGPLIYGICIAFSILSCVSVLLRLYTRRAILHTFGLDDVAIIVAQVLSFGVTVTTILQVALGGLGRHTEFSSHEKFMIAMKALYSNTLVYNAAQIITKISFLLQYRRLFPGTIIPKVCLVGIVFLIVWGVSQQFITAISCIHFRIIQPQWRVRCVPTFIVVNLNSIMNIITDFGIFAIPIWPVMHLQMPMRRKMHLLAVFCLGFFACAVSIVRLTEIHRHEDSSDPAWDTSSTAYWSTVELNVGILCACLPTLRPLLRKIAPRLLGSTGGRSENYNSHKLNTISSRRPKAEHGDGIYIHKEVEFESTTELRSKELTNNSPVQQETWLEISNVELNETTNGKT